MSYISKIDPETAGEKEKEVIRNHLAQGYSCLLYTSDAADDL